MHSQPSTRRIVASKHPTGGSLEGGKPLAFIPQITRLDSPGEAAELIKASSSLGLSSGILLGILLSCSASCSHYDLPTQGVPIPSEEAAAGAKIETAIKTALQEADAR